MMKEDKIPQEMVEFQPDALELKNERLPFAIRFCVWMPFIVMLAAIIWASLAEVDVIVEAPGKLVSRTPNITIKPLERTVIKKINVKVGDVVKPDQILITFDPTIHQAENERLEREVATLTAQFNRLYAEFTDKEYKIEDKNQDDQRWQHAIYLQRRSYYKERMNYFKQEIERCKAQQETTRESHKTPESHQADRRHHRRSSEKTGCLHQGRTGDLDFAYADGGRSGPSPQQSEGTGT